MFALKQEHLVLLHQGVAVRQVREPQAQGFHLGAGERDPRLDGLLDEVVWKALRFVATVVSFFFSSA